MTVEEIFNKVATHMLDGIMIHDEMAEAFAFLGLYGYSKCHDYHHIAETINYRNLSHYYSTRYHKLLTKLSPTQPQLIPETWRKYTTFDVDTNTKRNAIKDLMTKWVEWERDTKKCYSEMKKELFAIDEYAAAAKISDFLADVDTELHTAEKYLIKLNSINYDIVTIEDHQDTLHKKYKKKLGW